MNRHVLVVAIVLLMFSISNVRAQYQYSSVTEADVANADTKAATANAMKESAFTTLTNLLSNLKQQFEASPEFTTASDAANAAHDAYETERNRVVAALQTDDGYIAACKTRDEDVQALAALRSSGASGQDVVDAANSVLKSRTAVASLEATALATDKDFQAAKKVMLKTAAAVDKLRREFKLSLANRPDYSAVKIKLDAASADAAAANGEATAVHAARAAIEQARIDERNRDAADANRRH